MTAPLGCRPRLSVCFFVNSEDGEANSLALTHATKRFCHRDGRRHLADVARDQPYSSTRPIDDKQAAIAEIQMRRSVINIMPTSRMRSISRHHLIMESLLLRQTQVMITTGRISSGARRRHRAGGSKLVDTAAARCLWGFVVPKTIVTMPAVTPCVNVTTPEDRSIAKAK